MGLRPQGPANCHVAYARNYYSVSHLLVGSTVDLRVTEGQGGGLLRRRARGHAPQVPVLREEPLLHARLGTCPRAGAWSDWDAPRIRAWASRVGPSCSELVDRVFACYEFDEQGFNAALAVLRLSRRPGEARAGVRDGARDREEVAALPRRRARAEVGAGQGASRRGVRGLRLRARRRLLRGGEHGRQRGDRPQAQGDGGRPSLLAALSAQDEAVCAGMAFAERVQMAVDEAHSDFITQKVRNLTRRAGLRYPRPTSARSTSSRGRGLDRVAVAELATCGFVGRGENVVLRASPARARPTACALARPPAPGG